MGAASLMSVGGSRALHVAATPRVFGPPERRLVGFFHEPHGGPAWSTGVVLCSPIGYEAAGVHRTYRELASRLAARGYPALRFDYDGTGDSAGSARDAYPLRRWLDSISAAVDELRTAGGVRSVALFGVRFGGTLAALAALERRDVDELILWAPTPSGRVHLRELRLVHLVRSGGRRHRGRAPDLDAATPLSDATAASLSAIDLLTVKDRLAKRVLLLQRDDLTGQEAALARAIEATGTPVDLHVPAGFRELMREAEDSVVPTAALESVIDWLVDAHAAERSPRPRLAVAPSAPAMTEAASGGGMREVIVQFGVEHPLFGVLTAPSASPGRSDGPTLILLNVGAQSHVGPGRIYVTLARELASRGHKSLRFDIAGLGESPLPPNARESRLCSPASVDDVRAAMTFLGDLGHGNRFILAGLCSGASLAFHTAATDRRVVGAVLLNPRTFDWLEWTDGASLAAAMQASYSSTRHYARALFDAAVWARALRGQVQVRGIARVLMGRLRARARADLRALSARAHGRKPFDTDIARTLREMSARGVRTLLVYGDEDGGLEAMAEHFGHAGRHLRRMKNVDLRIVEDADHTFSALESQRTVIELTCAYVDREFSAARAR